MKISSRHPAGSLSLLFSDSRGTACRARTRHKHTGAIPLAACFKIHCSQFSRRDNGTIAPSSSAGHGMPCPY